MLSMKRKNSQFRHYVRTTPRIKRMTEGLRDRVAQCEPYASRRKKLTYEAFINAAWFWLDSLDAEVLAENLRPHIEEVERMWPVWQKELEDGTDYPGESHDGAGTVGHHLDAASGERKGKGRGKRETG